MPPLTRARPVPAVPRPCSPASGSWLGSCSAAACRAARPPGSAAAPARVSEQVSEWVPLFRLGCGTRHRGCQRTVLASDVACDPLLFTYGACGPASSSTSNTSARIPPSPGRCPTNSASIVLGCLAPSGCVCLAPPDGVGTATSSPPGSPLGACAVTGGTAAGCAAAGCGAGGGGAGGGGAPPCSCCSRPSTSCAAAVLAALVP